MNIIDFKLYICKNKNDHIKTKNYYLLHKLSSPLTNSHTHEWNSFFCERRSEFISDIPNNFFLKIRGWWTFTSLCFMGLHHQYWNQAFTHKKESGVRWRDHRLDPAHLHRTFKNFCLLTQLKEILLVHTSKV